jgi:hypothetical protein
MILFLLFYLLSLHCLGVTASPLPPWLSNLIPQKGSNIQDEIKCYSLPYGGVGFLSHILTYWTILCLAAMRRPYFPVRNLTFAKVDVCLSVIQVVVTLTVAIFTMIRCRQSWEFTLIAVWRLGLSLTVGWWSFYASISALANNKADRARDLLAAEFSGKKKEDREELLAQLRKVTELARAGVPREFVIRYRYRTPRDPTYDQSKVDTFLRDIQRSLKEVSINVDTSRLTIRWLDRLQKRLKARYTKYTRIQTQEDEELKDARRDVEESVETLYTTLRGANNIVKSFEARPEKYPNPWHLTIYLVFCVLGVIGHGGLVRRATITDGINESRLYKVNLAFGFIIVASTFVTLLITTLASDDGYEICSHLLVWPILYMFCCIFVMTAFWSDWLLGVIANDLTGVPSGDVAPLYWVSRVPCQGSASVRANAGVLQAYFVAKRLPFLIS